MTSVAVFDERQTARDGSAAPIQSGGIGFVTLMPADAIDRLLAVPYLPGGGTWAGADCWGVVELWYRNVLGIEVGDRGDLPAGRESVQAASAIADDWLSVDQPQDHCLVLMRAGRLAVGHVGVFYQGCVLHSDEGHGCVYQPITERAIRARTTGHLIRK